MTKKTAAIADEKGIISCFNRRKDGIKKKTWELSVLCDVKACAIIIGPDGEIETWPENSAGVLEVVRGFQNSGSHKPSPDRYAAVFGKKEQGKSNEEENEKFERFLNKLKEEEEEREEEDLKDHIPNVQEFDEWVNSNWSDRTTLDEPKQETGFLQMMMNEQGGSGDEVLIHNNPAWLNLHESLNFMAQIL